MRLRFAVAAAVMSLVLSVAAQKEMHMVHAKGSFDIKMTPAEATDFEKANDITRFTSDKTWHGDFEGVSHGEMITGSTASTGSMAYVAIERMTGKLNGRQGSFTFAHRATMMKGDAPSADLFRRSGETHLDLRLFAPVAVLAGAYQLRGPQSRKRPG
jgi:hypothetical protein